MRARKAFTLIELLIVVAIIGILATTLVPSLTDGPARARDTERLKRATNIMERLEAFNIDYGHYPNVSGCIVVSDSSNEIQVFIRDYLDGEADGFRWERTSGICRSTARKTHWIYYVPQSGGYYLRFNHEKGREGAAESTDSEGIKYYTTTINRY